MNSLAPGQRFHLLPLCGLLFAVVWPSLAVESPSAGSLVAVRAEVSIFPGQRTQAAVNANPAATALRTETAPIPLWGRFETAVTNTRNHAIRVFAERIELAAMIPQPQLASTRYCLANPGMEYLVYQPSAGKTFSVELRAGAYRYEWFDRAQGQSVGAGSVQAPGGSRQFTAHFAGDAMLYLKAP